MDDLENWIEIDEAKAKAKAKKENIKLFKEVESLMAKHREELKKSVASMHKDFKAVPSKYAQQQGDPQEFMPAYDINNSDGSATLNWMKAALLPQWRETFFNKIVPWRKNLDKGEQK